MRNEPPSSVFAVSGALRRFSADIGSSAPNLASCPDESLPEFAFIGRSNVGKSSLLNMLAGRPGHGSGRSGRSPRDAFCLQCLQPYPALVSGEIGLGPGGSPLGLANEVRSSAAGSKGHSQHGRGRVLETVPYGPYETGGTFNMPRSFREAACGYLYRTLCNTSKGSRSGTEHLDYNLGPTQASLSLVPLLIVQPRSTNVPWGFCSIGNVL